MAKNKNTPDVNKDDKSTKSVKSENKSKNNVSETENVSDPIETVQNEPAGQNTAELLSAEKDKYLRLAAEYDNYRKRSAKEREKIYTEARTDAISKLLPVYDNLERALKMECSDESFYKGVEMIMTQMTETLNSMGVQEIPAVGEPFDQSTQRSHEDRRSGTGRKYNRRRIPKRFRYRRPRHTILNGSRCKLNKINNLKGRK